MTNKQAEIALAKKIESSSFETLLAILDKCISSEKTMKDSDLVANLALQKKIKAKLVKTEEDAKFMSAWEELARS